MSCVERPRSPNPLPTFQVLRVADGWLPATHVLQSILNFKKFILTNQVAFLIDHSEGSRK